ncbi:hypothetical protein GEMRC1_004072 [Eukaryota sp. GEM-RC1]
MIWSFLSGTFDVSRSLDVVFAGNSELWNGSLSIECFSLSTLSDTSLSILGGVVYWNISWVSFLDNSVFHFSSGYWSLITLNVFVYQSHFLISGGLVLVGGQSKLIDELLTADQSVIDVYGVEFSSIHGRVSLISSVESYVFLTDVTITSCKSSYLIRTKSTMLTIQNSTILNISGSVMSLATASIASVDNVQLFNISSSLPILDVDSSLANFTNLSLLKIKSTSSFSISSKSRVMLSLIKTNDSVFLTSTIRTESSEVVVRNCSYNLVSSKNLIFVQLSEFFMSRITLLNSKFSTIGTFISSSAVLSFSNSLFQDSIGDVAFDLRHSTVSINDLTLLPSLSLSQCALLLTSSIIELTTVTAFDLNTVLLVSSRSQLMVRNVQVINYYSPEPLLSLVRSTAGVSDMLVIDSYSSLFSSVFSDLSLSSSSFSNISSHVVYSGQHSDLSVDSCMFNHGLDCAIIATDSIQIEILNSSFNNNIGKCGGGVRVNEFNVLRIGNSTFSSNTAVQGGALCLKSSSNPLHFEIFDNLFTNNSASVSGGAMFLNFPDVYNVSNNEFISNYATFWGSEVATNPRHLIASFNDPNSTAYYRDLIVTVTDGYNQSALLTLTITTNSSSHLPLLKLC